MAGAYTRWAVKGEWDGKTVVRASMMKASCDGGRERRVDPPLSPSFCPLSHAHAHKPLRVRRHTQKKTHTRTNASMHTYFACMRAYSTQTSSCQSYCALSSAVAGASLKELLAEPQNSHRRGGHRVKRAQARTQMSAETHCSVHE